VRIRVKRLHNPLNFAGRGAGNIGSYNLKNIFIN
jgi:hypothetical protein